MSRQHQSSSLPAVRQEKRLCVDTNNWEQITDVNIISEYTMNENDLHVAAALLNKSDFG